MAALACFRQTGCRGARSRASTAGIRTAPSPLDPDERHLSLPGRNPHSMLCDDVKRHAYFFLDGSLPEANLREFQSHLDDCSDCDTRVVIHRRIRRFLRERMAPLAAPESLRLRLAQTLRAGG